MDKNYEENLEYDFLKTIRNVAGYKGKIIILDYGMTEETVRRIVKKYNADVFRFNIKISVFADRYKDIPIVLSQLDEDITDILVSDGGDIWFQEQITEIFGQSEKGIACIEENRVFGEDEWVNKCLNNLPAEKKKDIMKVLKGNRVKNSGVICGKKSLLEELLKNVYNDIVDCGYDFFGIDQLYFNYEWYQLESDDRLALDETYNYVLVSHKEDYHADKNGEIITNNNVKVKVVHNAGGNWRMFDRPFANKSENYEQYVIENVYKLSDKINVI